ncbi:ATP-binding cassette domain-containing protein [Daejeonella sp.]|uniref:ATP-binding cassette domain-containing protein n=1 Tax=Daejeonella sp. TaxID=2805397 RepID=UPI0027198BB8|nr:ATP-binding cassette domain-containing protein [Daejeonella sp.]MDO8994907.1 ATP-binding cassette domain-containing protein [Daejeonella sp.]MDP2414663.1 ATP-binding cassette domain-containing protein [Daejeonella sp.]
MNNLLISFRNVSIRQYNSLVFEGLNFDFEKGQNWALVGKSGSGKSTLLDFIIGKASMARGEANYPYFDSYIAEYDQDDPFFNRYKLMTQVSARHEFRNLSNTSDFYYQQRFNSCDSEDADTVANYLSTIKIVQLSGFWTFKRVTERLKLLHLLDKQLIKLSNGETKRLLIASALISNPLLLLLDNPLNGLDVAARQDFNELIREISDSGINIIMATTPSEIPEAISHVAVLDQGKIISKVPSDQFNPENLYLSTADKINRDELKELLSQAQWPLYQTIIGMENVSIRYGDKLILDQVNWQMKQGEHWMLIGHNGAGKSTLLSLINGDNPQAFANKITLFDQRKGTGESIWEIKKKIGYVSPELFQYFPTGNTCLQVIESGFDDTLGLFRVSSKSKAETSMRWMKLLRVEEYAGRMFRNVPVSVQRICMLARAMVKNPVLLILDEPCLGLDFEQQDQFKNLIDEICSISNLSLIYVSHYQNEMPECITHSLKLEQGRVV